ncbi:MAG: M48 family metalloprotease [Firmicutes bacterium]|nr:M48 family metalloprotease [Bacillota bacterium]
MIIKSYAILVVIIAKVQSIIMTYIQYKQNLKTLPEEVKNIYDEDRYQIYLSYETDYRKVKYICAFISVTVEVFIIFSPFFKWIETIAGDNVYMIIIATIVAMQIIDAVTDIPVEYYSTFVIEEKYNLNKKSQSEFLKDIIIEKLGDITMMILLIIPTAFIIRYISAHTDFEHMTYMKSFMIACAVALAAYTVILVMMILQFLLLRLQYKFTEMPDNELKNKIIEMTKDCKKKIQKINVYNESAKSTSKNAFLLKMPFYREFGIADNFLDENSERELLAVLAHETGHLKYKKKPLDYINYLILVFIFILIVWAIPNADYLYRFNEYIMKSFNLHYTNYYLIISIILIIIKPVNFIFDLIGNYTARKQEYYADHNAAALGYGDDLINTFRKMSTDELICVNPAPIDEFLNYSHPGMYNRIKAINEYQQILGRPSP